MMWLVVCLGVVMIKPMAVEAQGCNASQDNAVQCFVGNAVKTNPLTLHYGMTLSQYKAYGVSVSKILQDQQTAIVLLGTTSAIADVMPATNADATANAIALQTAVSSIVTAALNGGLVTMPAESTQQDLVWFAEDLVAALGTSQQLFLSQGRCCA